MPNIISVAATNESDELSSYSNYGIQSVDVAAPGGNASKSNIFGTIPPERITLFSDDFENGGSKWLTSGSYAPWNLGYSVLFGSNVIMDSVDNYHAYENSWLATANPIDATGCKGLNIQFKIYYSMENNYDFLNIEGSLDGVNYAILETFTGSSGSVLSINDWTNDLNFIPFYLRFRLTSDYLYNYDGIYMDDISVTAIPWVFDGNEYGYKSGTSMAAPVVSGVAGLIWSYVPELTHLQVKALIMGTGDKLDSLNDKVYYGSRVNAYNALLYITDEDDIPQYWELTYFYTCSRDGTGDYDNDGLNDLKEYQNNTNPTVSDTDGDSLSDGGEVNLYKTSPNDSDSDGDRMPDSWEVTNDLNPILNDANEDKDNDGFSNLKEYQRRTDPSDNNSHPSKGMPWLPLLLES